MRDIVIGIVICLRFVSMFIYISTFAKKLDFFVKKKIT